MLLMLCLATASKLGHQFSLSLDCKGLHSRMEYRKKPILPKYSIKIVQLPQPIDGEDMGALFLDPTQYASNQTLYLKAIYKITFDEHFDPHHPSPAYQDFKNNMQILFDLINDRKYNKVGNYSASYTESQKYTFLNDIDSGAIRAALDPHNEHDPDDLKGLLLPFRRIPKMLCPEGWTLRACLTDQAVFENDKKIKIVVGPLQNMKPDRDWQDFKQATHVDDLNLSADFLTRAGIVAQAADNQKDLELIVVGIAGITEADIRKKIDTILQGPEYGTAVQSSAPKELNVATMGSMGLSAAYHYHTHQFIFTARSGIDHTWGTFRQTAPHGTNTSNNPSLGWGVFTGTGVDYKWTNNVALGLEGGMRFNQLKTTLLKDSARKSTMWFPTPYAQVNCTFFAKNNTSLGIFSGYIFNKEFTITSTGTHIPYGTPCKIDGLYGGLRLSKYF